MSLKEDLDVLYREWQERIESRNASTSDYEWAGLKRYDFICRFKTQRKNLENEILSICSRRVKRELKQLIEEVDQFKAELYEKHENFRVFVYDTVNEQNFKRFTADESIVGDQCMICMEEIELGRNMMRLNCDGQHFFCQVCIRGWFEDHDTCPICRSRILLVHAF